MGYRRAQVALQVDHVSEYNLVDPVSGAQLWRKTVIISRYCWTFPWALYLAEFARMAYRTILWWK